MNTDVTLVLSVLVNLSACLASTDFLFFVCDGFWIECAKESLSRIFHEVSVSDCVFLVIFERALYSQKYLSHSCIVDLVGFSPINQMEVAGLSKNFLLVILYVKRKLLLRPAEKLIILYGISAGRLVHRDLNPENRMFDSCYHPRFVALVYLETFNDNRKPWYILVP